MSYEALTKSATDQIGELARKHMSKEQREELARKSFVRLEDVDCEYTDNGKIPATKESVDAWNARIAASLGVDYPLP